MVLTIEQTNRDYSPELAISYRVIEKIIKRPIVYQQSVDVYRVLLAAITRDRVILISW